MTREEVLEIMKHVRLLVTSEDYKEAFSLAIKALQEPEIVHCKDCAYWLGNGELRQCGLAGYLIGERGYCLYGKKAGE